MGVSRRVTTSVISRDDDNAFNGQDIQRDMFAAAFWTREGRAFDTILPAPLRIAKEKARAEGIQAFLIEWAMLFEVATTASFASGLF